MAERVSVAQGGPRDGVKLMCPSSWDGTIERPRNVSGPITRYPGRYVWDVDFKAWIWHADR
jgi:hypothetical protein